MLWLGIRGNGTLSHALPRKFRLGNINHDVVTGDLRRKRSDLDGGVVIVLAGAAIELPGVPGTGEVRAVDGPLSQRSAAVRTGSRERVNAAIHIADGEAV